MDVEEAVAKAKAYVSRLYADEQVANLELEETEHDQEAGRWVITLGFSRRWSTPRTRAQEVLEQLGSTSGQRRSYKVITVAEDGAVLSMKNRAQAAAAE